MFEPHPSLLRRLCWKLWRLVGGPRYDGSRLQCRSFRQALAALGCRRDPGIRREAAHDLARRGDPRAVKPLLRTLETEGSPLAQWAAGEALRHPTATAPLLALLKSPADHVRMAAARALGPLVSSDEVEPLLVAMNDPTPRVRVAAIETVAPLADPRLLEPLLRAMQDPAPEVRLAATRSVTPFTDPRVLDALLDALDSDLRGSCSIAIQAAAARALSAYRDPRAVDRLVRHLSSPAFMLRRAAQEALTAVEWQPSNNAQRLALAVAACDWETVTTYGAAAARPLAAALGEGDWDMESDEPLQMDQARTIVEGILSERAGELDEEVLGELANLHTTIREMRVAGEDAGWVTFDHIDLGNCDRIREMAGAELERRRGRGHEDNPTDG